MTTDLTTTTPDIIEPPPIVLTAQQVRDKAAWIAAYREMLDWMEASPNIPAPATYNTYNIFVKNRAAMMAHRRGAGPMAKDWVVDYFVLRRTFGGSEESCHYVCKYDLNIARDQVCRKVVTGTKTVPAVPERQVEIVEWVCDDEPRIEGA